MTQVDYALIKDGLVVNLIVIDDADPESPAFIGYLKGDGGYDDVVDADAHLEANGARPQIGWREGPDRVLVPSPVLAWADGIATYTDVLWTEPTIIFTVGDVETPVAVNEGVATLPVPEPAAGESVTVKVEARSLDVDGPPA